MSASVFNIHDFTSVALVSPSIFLLMRVLSVDIVAFLKAISLTSIVTPMTLSHETA